MNATLIKLAILFSALGVYFGGKYFFNLPPTNPMEQDALNIAAKEAEDVEEEIDLR